MKEDADILRRLHLVKRARYMNYRERDFQYETSVTADWTMVKHWKTLMCWCSNTHLVKCAGWRTRHSETNSCYWQTKRQWIAVNHCMDIMEVLKICWVIGTATQRCYTVDLLSHWHSHWWWCCWFAESLTQPLYGHYGGAESQCLQIPELSLPLSLKDCESSAGLPCHH